MEYNAPAAEPLATPESAVETVTETVVAYKGFDKDFKCRGYQFEVGKTYQHEGQVKACENGFHSCENPLDVLNYYPLIADNGELSRFASVKASGKISRHGDDSKIASATLTVEAELKLPKLVRSAIEWVVNACKSDEPVASGDSSKLAASGDSSKLAASGDYSQLAASGDSSKLAASGYSSKLAASGNSSIVISAAQNSTAMVGENGCIVLTRWVEHEKRYRVSIGYTGENIKEGAFYKINDAGEFVEVAA